MKITKKIKQNKDEKLSGYPDYPKGEDIFNKDTETDIDPEKIEEMPMEAKDETEKELKKGGKRRTNTDLDVPGEELDDEKEITGSEDEENNYYSLGGDNHNDLEEDNSAG